MNGVNAVLMSDARAFLVRKVNELSERRSIDEVFTAWLLPHENLGLEPPEKAAAEAATHTGAARSYQDVAVLGFRADIGTNQPQIEALEHGFGMRELETDPELNPIRDRLEFRRLVHAIEEFQSVLDPNR